MILAIDKWIEIIVRHFSSFHFELFQKLLRGFLLVKIIFLLPVITTIHHHHAYPSSSIIKKLLFFPSLTDQNIAFLFFIIAGVIILSLFFFRSSYYTNALVWWLSVNISHFAEAVNNGSDYVLNLMLFLSIPLNNKGLLKKWEPIQKFIIPITVLTIQLHLGLIYFHSGYDKLCTASWRNGEAIQHIAALDFYAINFQLFLSAQWISYSLAWFVILFELLFPLFIWFERMRRVVLIIGILFHTGIIYFLNLPDFGLLMILCYSIFLRKNWQPVFKN
jgi:uncharacterized membrane protein YphA (DoxX/SURF4 family)